MRSTTYNIILQPRRTPVCESRLVMMAEPEVHKPCRAVAREARKALTALRQLQKGRGFVPPNSIYEPAEPPLAEPAPEGSGWLRFAKLEPRLSRRGQKLIADRSHWLRSAKLALPPAPPIAFAPAPLEML